MNAISNKTRLFFCDICDETNNFSSRSRHIISNSRIHKKEYGTVVKE